MLQTYRNAFKIPELRKKILFTLFIILIYRLGAVLPVPFVNPNVMNIAAATQGSIFEYMNILSGDAFSKATLFALSVSPYITASIVIQLLSIAIPALERLSKTEDGKKKINSLTRLITVVLALVTSYGYYMILKHSFNALNDSGHEVFVAFVVIGCYCAGAALVMWLAEKINESGIGNGISMILFANIVARVPSSALSMLNQFINGCKSIASGKVGGGILDIAMVLVSLVFIAAIVIFIVFITESERKIPVQYAKRVVGRKMYGGQSTTLPIKLNMTGVMPIIFASSIVSLPATITAFFQPKEGGFWDSVTKAFSYTSPLYAILNFVLIIAFAYFYVAISFNPIEVANNLKKNGGSIPGVRPGKPTSDYISKILSKVTLMGAIFLGIIAVLPLVINMICLAFDYSGLAGMAFGGSSIIIVVGVAVETQRDIEAQMTMRHYKGFLE